MIKCIAFDCFGTIFDMKGVPRIEIEAYVNHVRKGEFVIYEFPETWYSLKSHIDAAQGMNRLKAGGFFLVALSNGGRELIREISLSNDIPFDYIVDLRQHKVYKPHIEAYRTVEKDTGIKPEETLMVTANPTFGDVEGSAAIGMPSQVIRQADGPRDLIDLAEMLGC